MTPGKIKGYLFGSAAAISYGLNPAFALPLYADGMNPDSVLLLRYGLAIPMIAIMMLCLRRSFRVPGSTVPSLAGLGLLMALSSLTLYISYNYMAAGIASTILFVYPILVSVIMVVFCHERIRVATVMCLAIASCGILLLYNTSDGGTLSLKGTLIVLLSALAYAIYLVWVGKERIASLSTITVTFYVLCFGLLLFVCRIATGVNTLTMPSKWYLWVDAVLMALLPTAVSLACTKIAINSIGSTPTAILGALEPVTALVVGMIFFDEGMTPREAAGITLILIAVAVIILQGSSVGGGRLKYLERFKRLNFGRLKGEDS